LKIEWTNPIVIAAMITATAAVVAALVQTFKKTGESRSQQQTVTRSSGTTQIAAGRDVHIENSKKDQRVDNSQN
jgi:hypothetical protein